MSSTFRSRCSPRSPTRRGPGGAQPKKIEVARTAVYRILENAVRVRASFGLVTFTEVARVAVPLTEMRRENLPSIESLLSMLQPSGRSAIWDALALAADLLRSLHGGVRGQDPLGDGWLGQRLHPLHGRRSEHAQHPRPPDEPRRVHAAAELGRQPQGHRDRRRGRARQGGRFGGDGPAARPAQLPRPRPRRAGELHATRRSSRGRSCSTRW